MKSKKGKLEKIKEIRCTMFEYSSSDSEEENDKGKSKTGILSTYKAKTSMNLPFYKKKKSKKIFVYLSRYVRMILFFLLLIFSVVIDLDSGIIVSSYKSFTQDMHMSDIQFGTISSIINAGEIIGLLIYMPIINKNHRKFIVVMTSFLHGVGFFGYFINSNFYYIAILNFLISICKAFVNVYIPVWIDQFGIKKYKTLLLTILYMAISLGMIIGAWIGTVLFNNEWKKAFICCGIIFIILSLSLFSIPQKYYSTKFMIVEQQKSAGGNVVEKVVLTKSEKDDTNNIKKNIEHMKDIKFIGDDNKISNTKKKKKIKFGEGEKKVGNDISVNNDKKEKLLDDNESNNNNINNINNINKDEEIITNFSVISKLKLVFFNKNFIFSSLSKAIIFYIFEIIYVYLKKYSFEALNYNDEMKFFYYYSLTTILAPSLGGLIGGAICNKFFGGYESKNSIWVIIFFGTLALIFVSLVRVSMTFNHLIIYIFGYFFSVSAFLPTISGYIINSLNKELKGFGSSFDNLLTNVFELSSPIIYGLINDKYKETDPKYAWNISLLIYYVGMLFIFLACFSKWKINSKKTKVKKDVVTKTVKDAYNLSRSSLVRADKPIPQYADGNNNNIAFELENLDTSSRII